MEFRPARSGRGVIRGDVVSSVAAQEPRDGSDSASGVARRPGVFGARRRLEQAEVENQRLVQQMQVLNSDLARQRLEADQTAGQLRTRVAELQEALRNKQAEGFARETRAAEEQLAQTRTELSEAREARDRERVSTEQVRDDAERVRRGMDADAQQARRDAARLTARAHTEANGVLEEARSEARRLIAEARAEAQQISALGRTDAKELLRKAEREVALRQGQLDELEAQIVATEDVAMLQQAGVYEFRHRLEDAVAYKTQLDHLKEAIKTLVRRDSAILSIGSWTVNGSSTEGRRMVRDFSKLMLRAYNAEADNCVRTMKPHRLASSVERLEKARDAIAKLGASMNIRIDPGYHSVRTQELELTADYLTKQEEEKERVRAERERQRDEDAARKEFEREKARLAKEKAHWERVRAQWVAAGEDAKVSEARDKLERLDEAIAGVEAREANIRTGWVYVISNLGAFGESMVKIGLTRRLDPYERVRELGDASVPFRFDVHALVFSEDAVGLENRLHHDLADRRVNRVNLRREFFHATPAEVLAALKRTEARDHLLEFTETAEASEWRASLPAAT